MRKHYCLNLILLIFVVCASIPESIYAQERDFFRVETTDGNVFIAERISEDDESIVFYSETLGEIRISRINIRRMTLIDKERIREGEYWYENPQATRYFFAPNATGLKKGKGYYQNTWIFFNNVNYGVSNNFSIGAGTIPWFLFGQPSPVWIIPKISIPVANTDFHLSAGAVIGSIIGRRDVQDSFDYNESTNIGGVLFGFATYAKTNTNVSIGLGYGYDNGSLSSTPVINISAMHRYTRTSYIITENYFFPGTVINGMVSIGYRWAPEKFALDFALLRPLLDLDSFIAFPWLGITIPFGD